MHDELYSAIGGFGRWQIEIFAIFGYANIVSIFMNFAMTFLAPNVPFRCATGGGDNSSSGELPPWEGQCFVNASQVGGAMPCTEWEYDTSEYSETLVSKFDLVCDREWLISLSKSTLMAGFLVSVVTFGQLSDRIGRYPTLVLCYVITCVSMVLSLFPPTFTAFLVYRFFMGFGRISFMTVGYVMVLEICSARHRTVVGMGMHVCFAAGIFLLGLIGYFVRHWFWFQLSMYLPMFIFAAALPFIPESPCWLMAQGKTQRFEKLVIAAAKKNGRQLTEDALRRLVKAGGEEKHRGTILDLFRCPRMRTRILRMMYLWITTVFIYYAVSFNTNDLAGDPHLNYLLSAALELPATGMLLWTLPRYGRRWTLVTLQCLSGVCYAVLVFVPSDLVWLPTTMYLCVKFCSTASFNVLYLYTGELFPTVVRNVALGSCSTVSRIGSILAPFSRELAKTTHPAVSSTLYSMLVVSSGIMAIWLPETTDRKLADTLEEGEAFETEAGK